LKDRPSGVQLLIQTVLVEPFVIKLLRRAVSSISMAVFLHLGIFGFETLNRDFGGVV